MRFLLRPIVMTSVLTLAGGLWAGAGTANAQSAGAVSYPGYYYSPGGYSGGYYFSPGYYRSPGAQAAAPAARVYASPTRTPSRSYATHPDWTTARTNLPISKPWLRPLR